MKLLDYKKLDWSTVVANNRMNRERNAVGINSYEQDLGFDPIRFFQTFLPSAKPVYWVDLCCGRGRALIQAAEQLSNFQNARLEGWDLVGMFDPIPNSLTNLSLDQGALRDWNPTQPIHFISCVHGLHYVSDKLEIIRKACQNLAIGGLFIAHLDLNNLKSEDGQNFSAQLVRYWQQQGLKYDHKTRLLTCRGPKKLSADWEYLGANDQAGPNYTGQPAVDSYYKI